MGMGIQELERGCSLILDRGGRAWGLGGPVRGQMLCLLYRALGGWGGGIFVWPYWVFGVGHRGALALFSFAAWGVDGIAAGGMGVSGLRSPVF